MTCENDTDYDCEAWDDYDGALKPYIVAIQNEVYNFEWRYTLTAADINLENAINKLNTDYTLGALSAVPIARLGQIIINISFNVTSSNLVSMLIAGGVTNVVSGSPLFSLYEPSKLMPGNVLVFKQGKIVAVEIDGVTYSVAQVTGLTNISGSSEDYDTGEFPAGTEMRVFAGSGYIATRCYRDFSNGQRIYVPCP